MLFCIDPAILLWFLLVAAIALFALGYCCALACYPDWDDFDLPAGTPHATQCSKARPTIFDDMVEV